MAIITVTTEQFDELVINSKKPVLLDFWATWCGPCRMIAPHLEQIAAQREDIIIGKVNVDEEPELAKEFRIISIPTLILMKDGMAAEQAIGYMSKAEIEEMLG